MRAGRPIIDARLAWLLALGLLARLVVIALAPGETYDIQNIARIGREFLDSPLGIYHVNIHTGSYQGTQTYPWPYPPGFVPLAAALRWLAEHTGIAISRLDRSLIAVFDLTLAWLLHWTLGRLERPQRERLGAAALVAFGPVFLAVTGFHGQIDVVAWLPAVAAVAIWRTQPEGERALPCGLLLGLGILIKTTPVLALVALCITARDRREVVTLLAAAVAVIAVALMPFALSGTDGMTAIVHYRGFGGRAGLTSLLQPQLPLLHLSGQEVDYTPTTKFLFQHAGLIVAVALAAVLLLCWRRRTEPATTTAALILAFYLASPAVLPQYWVWLVPFLILAGHARAALAYQLALVPLLVANYGFLQEPGQPDRRLGHDLVLYGYVPYLWLFTLGLLAGLIVLLRRPSPRPAP